MESLKELLSKVDKTHPTEMDVKITSIAKFYNDLKLNGDIKKFKRLKLLYHLYPSVFTKNKFMNIESVVNNPLNSRMVIRDRCSYTAFEEYAIKKSNNGQIPYYAGSVSFKVSDLYEYFGISD